MSAKGENMYVVEHVHFMKPQTLNLKPQTLSPAP
jgi:hypothetical protein